MINLHRILKDCLLVAITASFLLAFGSCSALDSTSEERAGQYVSPLNPYSGRKIIFAKKDDSEVLRYVYRSSLDFVRIERIEPGVSDNTHPFEISIDTLRQRLASLTLKDVPVFSNDELNRIVPYLAAALAKASPKEDVTFAVTGKHGLFGNVSPKTVTTARIFDHDQRLHVIFGEMHNPFALSLQGTDILQPFTPGRRAERIETHWALTPGMGSFTTADRPDWISFDTARIEPAVELTVKPAVKPTEKPAVAPAAKPIEVPASKPVVEPAATVGKAGAEVDRRTEEINLRLRVLSRLKESGAITEDEYRERRRAILQEL